MKDLQIRNLDLEERLIHCIYNVSGSMRVDTVCIVSIVSGAEADTMYLQCICSLSVYLSSTVSNAH